MDWSGYVNVLNYQLVNKQQDWRLLVCDGRESHVTSNFLSHCIQYHIHMLLLPPHISHLTQPLDVGIFVSVKAAMSRSLDPLFRTWISRIEKMEWVEVYIEARATAFTKSSIGGGWCCAGLSLFNWRKVLRKVVSRIPRSPTPTRSTTLSPMLSIKAAFHQVTSSSPEPSVLRSANAALNQLVSGASFLTPAKIFIRRLTSATEQFQVDLLIQKKQIMNCIQLSLKDRSASQQSDSY
jgi:hypothetical protein